MGEVGRDLLRSSWVQTCAEAGSARAVAKICVQLGFDYLQGQRLHSLSGNFFRCLTPSVFRWNFIVDLCVLPLALIVGAVEKSLASSSFPPISHLYTGITPFLAFSVPGQRVQVLSFFTYKNLQLLSHL